MTIAHDDGQSSKPRNARRSGTFTPQSSDDDLKIRILRELQGGKRKGIVELMATTHAGYDELMAALEFLESEGRIAKTSDGFQAMFVRRP